MRRSLRRMVPLLTALYTLAGIAACLCYVPQILRLRRDAGARRAMSLATWGGWVVVSLIGLAYAAVVVRQPEMVVVSGLNLACQLVVFGLALRQWRADRLVTATSTSR